MKSLIILIGIYLASGFIGFYVGKGNSNKKEPSVVDNVVEGHSWTIIVDGDDMICVHKEDCPCRNQLATPMIELDPIH